MLSVTSYSQTANDYFKKPIFELLKTANPELHNELVNS